MTWDQYWHGDVWMVEAFRQADKLRRQRANNEAWLQGSYVYDAVGRLAPILHAFAKKGTKPVPYLSEPYSLGEAKSEQDKARLAENERLKSILYFKNWARATQKKFEK